MISVMDFKTKKLQYLNRTLFDLTGYDRNQMVRKSHEETRVLTHPDDVKAVDEYYEKISKATDDEIFELDYRAIEINGEWQ